MIPVTGPYTQTNTTNRYPPNTVYVGDQQDKVWYRQKRPYNKPLPYSKFNHYTVQWSSWPQFQAANVSGLRQCRAFHLGDLADENRFPYDIRGTAKARAHGRLLKKLGDSQSLLISLAERHQAMDMLTKRLLQMASFASALKKKDFYGAASALGIFEKGGTQKPKLRLRTEKSKRKAEIAARAKILKSQEETDFKIGRLATYKKKSKEKAWSKTKSFANNYLEFHFGWSPLVGDIYGAFQTLQADIPVGYIRGSHSEYWDFPQWSASFPEFNPVGHHKGVYRYSEGCTVKVSNPNLFLANRLGLLNLAAVPFELISYSFVLDWFVNCSEFLGQFTEFAGLEVAEQYYSESVTDSCFFTWEAGDPDFIKRGETGSNDRVRTVGPLPDVSLKIRAPWRLSPRRGLAAMSLLAQKLPGYKH